MTYRLLQLAPGSYDVELDGRIIASLVSYRSNKRWIAELLDERLPHPERWFRSSEQQLAPR